MSRNRRLVLGGVLSWVLVLGGLRALVVQAEHCGDPTVEELEAAADSAVGWFAHNQRPDGAWLYRYDRDADEDLGGYNITRHAGVTMSLEQAAGAGLATSATAAEVAERGIEWALGRTYEGPGWRAFAGDADPFGSGASALLTSALVLRRERTGDDRYDEALHDLGDFLVSMVNERGQVYGRYSRTAEAPVPDSWSRYFTGETFWALTLLHRAFPESAGYREAAERIARYIATERRAVERFQPDLPDHWAAYGFAVMSTWPGWELPDEYLPYVRRQSGLQSLQIRYESQRTNSYFSYRTRGRQTLGAGLGTIGEALWNWHTVAAATPDLADIREPLAERARCVGGVAIDRQVATDEVGDDDPERVLGAWFQFDVTQMDDQQHVLSALLGAAALARTSE